MSTSDNAEWPSAESLDALIDAARTDANSRRLLVQLLGEARLFFVKSLAGGREDAAAHRGRAGSVEVAYATVDDRQILPVFTSEARLAESVPSGAYWASLPARTLLAAVGPRVPVVLNPGSTISLVLEDDEVADVSGVPRGDQTASEGSELFLGLPAARPEQLVAALREYFSSGPFVRSAYLGQVARRDSNEPPHPIVGIDVDPAGDAEAIAQDTAVRADAAGGSVPIDVVVVEDTGLGAWLKENGERFFHRQN